MRPILISCLLALFVLGPGGCSSSQKPDYEITYKESEILREALQEGFAMAPVAQAEPIPGGTESLAFLTNELYTALLVFTEGIEIVEPGVLLKRIEHGGEDLEEFAQAFHRSRINREKLSQGDTAKLYPHVATRFLFLAWVSETGETNMRETATDYQDISNAMDIYNVTYRKFKGEIQGELIDLVTGERVWGGVARYATGEMYGDNRPDDLWTSRSTACTRLARLLSLD